MVGGRDFEGSRFNRATQSRGSRVRRSSRSSTPPRSSRGSRRRLRSQVSASRSSPTAAHGYRQTNISTGIRLRCARRCACRATALPSACCGPSVSRPSADYAEQLGVGKLPSVPSLALGSGEVTLLALTVGIRRLRQRAAAAPRRRSSGASRRATARSCTRQRRRRSRAVSPATAFLITSMLQDVINAGTGSAVREIGFRLPAAGRPGRRTTIATRGSSVTRRCSSRASGSATTSRGRLSEAGMRRTSPCRCGRAS